MPNADAPLYFVIDEKDNSVELTEKGLAVTGEGEDLNSLSFLRLVWS